MSVPVTESGVVAFLFCIITTFGLFSNGLIVFTFLRHRKTMLLKSRDVLIFTLSVSDFLASSLACPLAFSSAIVRRWIWGHFGCVWYAFITTWVALGSIVQMAVMAIERYVTLQNPMLNVVSARKIVKAVVVCWSLTFVVSLLPLLGWSEYTFEAFGLHCAIPWDIQTAENISFALFLLIAFFLVPVTVIVYSYTKIFTIIRQLYRNADRMWGTDAKATKDAYFAQVKAAKQTVFVILGFVFAWTPYAIMSALILLFQADISLGTREYPSMFAKASIIYNPIIYFFTYRRLRTKALNTLKCVHNVVAPESTEGT